MSPYYKYYYQSYQFKLKPLPPPGEAVAVTNTQHFFMANENSEPASSTLDPIATTESPSPKKKQCEDAVSCDVCHGEGNNTNLVTCDECKKGYHFTCLEPPLKKTPKRRGYSWHCADCDPTL